MSDPSLAISRRDFLCGVTAAVLLAPAAALAAPEPKSDRKVRIGVVGGNFGAQWQWHLDPNCIVEAVSDLRTDRREYLQQVYKCDKPYESLEKLVLDPKVEAVAVFTGAPDHARHVLECFKHGKHVISAVPACLTLDEAREIKEAKERTGLTYMMAETSYYRWPTILARQFWKEGRFGGFLYSEVEYYHNLIGSDKDGLSVVDGKRTWRYGYPPMLYPTHSTCFHVGVTGERLTSVSCLAWGDGDPALKDNPYNNPWCNQVALFATSGPSICRCNVFWRVHSDGERAQWLGRTMSMYMPGASGQPLVIREAGKKDVREVPDYFPLLPEPMRIATGHGNSHGFLTHEFITAFVENRPPAVDLYEALAMTVPGIVAMESSRKGGERLKVPGFDKN
ncbi:MAG: Gfo/Idh/MocA family oxidoreductase [Planctomycetota bacterium]|nr:Gfo/Idh/MocA family oxidoreductase [Planctomycetota bacterium]